MAHDDPFTPENISLLEQDAMNGDAYSQYWLGLCYRDRLGVRRNPKRAKRWFWKSLKGMVQDDGQRLELALRLSEDAGAGRSADEAAFRTYLSRRQAGLGAPHIPDVDSASLAALLAAMQGDAGAALKQAEFYQSQGLFDDAAVWYRFAAEQGDADAQFHLGCLYEEGKEVGQDIAEAERWFRMADEQGDRRARTKLRFRRRTSRSARAAGVDATVVPDTAREGIDGLAEGAIVSVTSGSLAGELGEVQEVKVDKGMARVKFWMMGRTIPVDIELDQLEVV